MVEFLGPLIAFINLRKIACMRENLLHKLCDDEIQIR